MLYLDTSAFLKLYVLESGSEAVQQAVASQSQPLPVCEIQEMEVNNALQLKVFWKELTQAEVDHQLVLFAQRKQRGFYYTPEVRRAQLMDDFRGLAAMTPELGCRTMDILHVAYARQLAVTHFLTFDKRQEQLALRAGLSVPDLGE